MKLSFRSLRNAAPAAIVLTLGAFSLGAQDPPPPPPPPPPPGQNVMFFTTQMSVDGKVVTGAPYSATSTTTMTQTLSNGTHITQTQQSTLARDSAGRTRREESMHYMGPWSTTPAPKSVIFINDPVAHLQYVLEPDSQTATRVSTAGDASPLSQKLTAEKMARHTVIVNSSASATSGGGPLFAQKVAEKMVGGDVIAYRSIENDKDTATETLPDQVIEGLTVHGKRITSTVPAGAMGNDQPIVTTTETWYSPDLQMMVLTKRSDPRVGDTMTALTGISRTEPAATLFQLPAGYTVKESDEPTEVHFGVHN